MKLVSSYLVVVAWLLLAASFVAVVPVTSQGISSNNNLRRSASYPEEPAAAIILDDNNNIGHPDEAYDGAADTTHGQPAEHVQRPAAPQQRKLLDLAAFFKALMEYLLQLQQQQQTQSEQCPEPTGLGVCAELCGSDDDCTSGQQICCSNGCGHTCVDPETPASLTESPTKSPTSSPTDSPTASPMMQPSGQCPAPPINGGGGICVELCASDGECTGQQICCSNGCGHVCMDPVPFPQQSDQCPEPSGLGICAELCASDADCPGQICCSNGCGHVCMDPVPTQRVCPAPSGSGACVELCSSDDDCPLPNQLCCSNGCGHVCTNSIPPVATAVPLPATTCLDDNVVVASQCHGGECPPAILPPVSSNIHSTPEGMVDTTSVLSYVVPDDEDVGLCLTADNSDSMCQLTAAFADVTVDGEPVALNVNLLSDRSASVSFTAPAGSTVTVVTTLTLDTRVLCVRAGSFTYQLVEANDNTMCSDEVVASQCHGGDCAGAPTTATTTSSIAYTAADTGTDDVPVCVTADNDNMCQLTAVSANVLVNQQVMASGLDLLSGKNVPTSYAVSPGATIEVLASLTLDTRVRCVRAGKFTYALLTPTADDDDNGNE